MRPQRRRCEFCEGPLPVGMSTRARFCCDAHRAAAHRAARPEREVAAAQLAELDAAERAAAAVAAGPAVPAELREGARWVRWRSVLRGGRPTKLPVDLEGRAASSTDPATWSSFVDAVASEVGNGLGVVLLEGDDIVCVDLDHCLVDGAPLPVLRRLLERLPAGWREISPSGDGVHVFGRSRRLVKGRRTVTLDGLSVEAYPSGRYITVTGVPFGEPCLELPDLDEVLEFLLGRLD